MAELTDLQKDLLTLAAEIKRLEAEYNMFFAGRLPRPPWEARGRVEAMIKRHDRGYITSTADRFRFEMLQSRFQKMIEVWDRGLRAREDGRPGPFAKPRPQAPPRAEADSSKVLHVTALRDPLREMDKVHALYDSLMEARRGLGEDVVPFHRFAALVKDQVSKVQSTGVPEVAFRVTMIDGKVNFTVRGKKGEEGE